MLEEVAERLIVALDRNTEAHGGKPPGGAGKPAAPPKPAAGLAINKVTMEQVKAACVEVKNAHGKPAAMKIIKEHGGAAEIAGIKPARYAAVLDACKEAMGESEPEEGDTGEDEL